MSTNILAIDDSHTLRQFIVKSLTRHSPDYVITTAKDGAEGVELAASGKPDLILLDFILPDFNGDEVCRRLLANPDVAGVPIVLMSSSAAEIKKASGEFQNVVRSLAKPFTPELLCATVNFVLREHKPKRRSGLIPPVTPAATPAPAAEEPKPAAPTPSPAPVTPAAAAPVELVFCGNTSYLPIIAALRAIEDGGLSGTLRIFAGAVPIEIHCVQGALKMVTSRDTDDYTKPANLNFPDDQKKAVDEAIERQKSDGRPFFSGLQEKDLLTEEQCAELVVQFGCYLFAIAWTAGASRIEFLGEAGLPDYAKTFQPPQATMDTWALEALRLVGSAALTAQAWGDATGIPFYTRKGFERIQQLTLNEEEVTFAGHVSSGGMTLTAIAEAMGLPVDRALSILFRFISLEIFDYWPSTAFKGE
jgi:CheY-like chemotaxis protein